MAYTDIAILIIIGIAMIVGFFRGFFRSLSSLLGSLVCLILAYVLTTFTVDLVTSIGPLHNILYGETGSLASTISEALPVAMQELSLSQAATAEGKAQITEALGGGLMGLLTPLILSLVGKFAAADLVNASMANCIGVIAARAVAWVVLFIVYFIILKLLSKLIWFIGDVLQRKKLSRALDRSFGLLVGAVKGLVISLVVLFGLSLISGLGFMSAYREDMSKSVIAKPLSDATVKILGSYINIDSLTGGLIKNEKEQSEAEQNGQTETPKLEAVGAPIQGLPALPRGYQWAIA